jgi:hypothetical protein
MERISMTVMVAMFTLVYILQQSEDRQQRAVDEYSIS